LNPGPLAIQASVQSMGHSGVLDSGRGGALHRHRYAPFLLLFGFGSANRTAWVRSQAALPSAPMSMGTSAVPKSSRSDRSRSLTGTAFAPPTRTRRVGPRFRAASATTQCSDFCWGIAFRSFVLRATTSVEPSRSPWVRRSDFATIPSPIRTRLPTDFGLRCWGPTYPPRSPHGASLALETVAHLSLPPDIPSRARRGAGPQRGLGAPGQRPCFFSVEFPPSGPRVWTFTSCQKRHAKRTPNSALRASNRAPPRAPRDRASPRATLFQAG
jgi:hypothetical protein